MGHTLFIRLPGTKKWRAVADLIHAGAGAEAIAAASARAAEQELAAAPNDRVFVESLRLLALIPQAAKQVDFSKALREIGIDAPANPGLMDLVVATTKAIDQFTNLESCPSDFGELSARALADSLATAIGDRLPGLFQPNSAEVQAATARLAGSDAFSNLARQFFGRLVSETLQSWLSRQLSAEVGRDGAFSGAADRSAFDAALSQYCSEATQIIKVFAGGWYGKTLYGDGTITPQRAAAFGAVAFKKINEELRRKRSDHD